ncbi:hypothetical protein SARC_04564 [Sphaeroforma arctica JP610]|uniref:Uncharacterized protein n=1 Tax=Sphaeroforma arctica JP610 TaxID=667725 RepID=A0A0L0G4M0_9EUKA|nr:hypothetical protein SARC_04564 [Sphaeroforma arctica JP610]KNC83178.1 hypothetical protein SARC_04564 [Sphaeroforma arctica JP610]|eukprot:XP_014157080.1 hypothetical protein SARC_04564 [Sphaeroforma arctica JP610]
MDLVYSSCGALLFSFYIIYDTQMIVGGEHKLQISSEEYVFAALTLYLDVINLFIFILRLLGSGNRHNPLTLRCPEPPSRNTTHVDSGTHGGLGPSMGLVQYTECCTGASEPIVKLSPAPAKYTPVDDSQSQIQDPKSQIQNAMFTTAVTIPIPNPVSTFCTIVACYINVQEILRETSERTSY